MNNRKTKYSWINVLLSAIVIVLLTLILNTLNRYGSISKTRAIFLSINIGFLILGLAILFFTIKANNSEKRTFKIAYTSTLVVLLAVSSYGLYLLDIVNVNIKDIVTQESLIEYQASFVVKKGEYRNVDQLSTKTIGMIESDKFVEGNLLPTDELEKLEFDKVKVKKYSSYPFLINALLKDEVDFISLPKEYNSLFMTDEQIAEDLPKIEAVHSFSGKYENTSVISGSDINVTEVPFTMLIMGNDGGRTDSLMLASVNPQSMQITLTSLARDSYVPIACYPGQARDKINHARTISRECSMETVENVLDVSIDFFVEVSFQGLVDLVDALGTIPIDSPAAFNGNIVRDDEIVGGVVIEKGLQDMNGDQVLAFVRERGSFEGGDFQRQMNQQHAIGQLITAIAETRDVNTLVNLVKATGKNVETNLSVTQLIDLMNLALARMDESSVLNASDIVTIYGNRVTGQGAMMYSPDYGFDLYYYVPYEGSIRDARALIDMNMRADGIMEIPTGFNYSVNDEYRPPTFGEEFYDEGVDPNIFTSGGPSEELDPVVEDTGMVTLIELREMTIQDAETYLSQYGFTYIIQEVIPRPTDDPNMAGVMTVASTTGGVTMDRNNNEITLKVFEYYFQDNTPGIDDESPGEGGDTDNPGTGEETENPDETGKSEESKPDSGGKK